MVKLCLHNQMVPHSRVTWKEGAKEGFCPGERDDKLVVPGCGSSGGVAVWLSPGLVECSQVRGTLLVSLKDNTQPCHITTLLKRLHGRGRLVWRGLQTYQALCSMLDLVKKA